MGFFDFLFRKRDASKENSGDATPAIFATNGTDDSEHDDSGAGTTADTGGFDAGAPSDGGSAGGDGGGGGGGE